PCQARLDIVDTSALVAEHLTPLA
ncbi:MAG TPA: ribose-phosphate pyrophosphokinase, partial [Pseudomonas sp.]|nr:ribose-phosphate pyrophosphokinase [Pseudomonas sp.]